MLLSTAIPIVIAAIVIVIISKGIPSKPIIPRIKKAAIKFGTTPIEARIIFLNILHVVQYDIISVTSNELLILVSCHISTSLVSNLNLFNSNYHLESYIDSLYKYLKKMPDFNNFESIEEIEKKYEISHRMDPLM